MDENTRIIYRQIQERMCKVTWSHTIQLEEAKRKNKKSYRIRCWKQGLSAVSSAGIITICFTSMGIQNLVEIGTAIVTTALMFITWLSDNKLDSEADRGRHIASELHDLRNKYESLLTDIKSSSIDTNAAIGRRNELEKIENSIYQKDLPSASAKAIERASIALKIDYQAKTTEEEINAIIPESLLNEN